MPADYIPWQPVCSGCGRISTTKNTGLDGLNVSYVCEGADVSKSQVSGCGYEGVSDAGKGMGKLPWRVEWAARWSHFKVTCEPFGKEHAAAGGSYDTSKVVSKEIFDWVPPVPVVYEFFTLNGEKISSSKGNVITLGDWLNIAEPEVLKYFMYKRLQKQRDINLGMLTNLVDEYDEAERIFHGMQEGDSGFARMYELAQVAEPTYLNVPYTLCAVLAQLLEPGQDDEIIGRVRRQGYKGFDEKRLVQRVDKARNWVKKYVPPHLSFSLLSEEQARAQRAELACAELAALSQVAGELGSDISAEKLHKRIYDIARLNGIDPPPKLFKAIYQVLIGQSRGPKAAMFLQSLGHEFVASRFC